MYRISLKHTHSTPFRIYSRLNCLLFCLCLIPITGCYMTRGATPDTWKLEIHDDASLPNLSLVRRVVPEVSTMSRTIMWATDDAVREVSESRFGDSDEEADLGCVYSGLQEALPGIDIVPTTTFWEQVADSDDVIELSELFVAPQADRLRAFNADVIVIAYHSEIDLASIHSTILIKSIFGDRDQETAAIIVIDLDRKAIIHGSKISFEDENVIELLMVVIPFGFFTLDPPDICSTVGRQAGAAIAEAMPGRTVRALVVVAGEDPYAAAIRSQ